MPSPLTHMVASIEVIGAPKFNVNRWATSQWIPLRAFACNYQENCPLVHWGKLERIVGQCSFLSQNSQNVYDELVSYPTACLSVMEINYWIFCIKESHILNCLLMFINKDILPHFVPQHCWYQSIKYRTLLYNTHWWWQQVSQSRWQI